MTMSTQLGAWPNHASNGHAGRTTSQTKTRVSRVAPVGNLGRTWFGPRFFAVTRPRKALSCGH